MAGWARTTLLLTLGEGWDSGMPSSSPAMTVRVGVIGLSTSIEIPDKPSAVVISTGVNERLRHLKLLNDVSPSHLYLFAQGRHLLLELLLLVDGLRQFPLQFFHLLIERTHGLLVLPLFVHHSGIVIPNTGDNPFLGNTTILKSLDAN